MEEEFVLVLSCGCSARAKPDGKKWRSTFCGPCGVGRPGWKDLLEKRHDSRDQAVTAATRMAEEARR